MFDNEVALGSQRLEALTASPALQDADIAARFAEFEAAYDAVVDYYNAEFAAQPPSPRRPEADARRPST